MDQLKRLIDFRQGLYDHVFTLRRDAQMELLDALLLGGPVRSFPYLSLVPNFRRQWSSAYAALEDGRQDQRALLKMLVGLLPRQPVRLFALDESPWPRPEAPTLEDRSYVHGARREVNSSGIRIGHSYSVLAFVAEPHSSWALPVSIERVATTSDAVAVGASQVKRLLKHFSGEPCEETALEIICGDTRYGNHRFLSALEGANCAVLVRLRSNRVLYRDPVPRQGRGRRPKHGAAFRFKDETTWGEPAQRMPLTDRRYGNVELRLWHGLHARQDATTRFSVLCARVRLEREHPPKPLWLAWQVPEAMSRERFSVEDLWRYYQQRTSLEASLRYRKEDLMWTKPQVATTEAAQRWTTLVTLAQWLLYWAREIVTERVLPWQQAQQKLTPRRVRQSLGGLFAQIGTPTSAPKRRGIAPGWPRGQPRERRPRYPVVRKGPQRGKRRAWAA
ncbi:transposase [Rhodocaloribacter sp.]